MEQVCLFKDSVLFTVMPRTAILWDNGTWEPAMVTEWIDEKHVCIDVYQTGLLICCRQVQSRCVWTMRAKQMNKNSAGRAECKDHVRWGPQKAQYHLCTDNNHHSPNVLAAVSKGMWPGSKTLLRQNPPILNWGCRLMEVVLYTGDQSFRVTAARAWNSLPTSVTTETSLASKNNKKHFFSQSRSRSFSLCAVS